MQIECRYSGITFNVENFANLRLKGVHPLFTTGTKHLLSRAGDWSAGKLNEKESRLLFLALLNNTDLVEFRVTATPEHSTVQKNMESLLRFISWQCGITNPAFVLPRFVVSRETADLSNVKHWIAAWYDARKDFEEGYHTQSELSKARNRELALERLIKNSQKKIDDYSGILATWAMDAGNVPGALREYWTSLFKMKGVAVYSAKKIDLEEMREHFEHCLEHGSIFAAATMRHVRLLEAKSKAGINFGLGIPDAEFERADFMNQDNFVIIEDSVETDNKARVAATAPNEMPVEKDYTSRVAFLKAKAAFNLAARAKNYYKDAVSIPLPEVELPEAAEEDLVDIIDETIEDETDKTNPDQQELGL